MTEADDDLLELRLAPLLAACNAMPAPWLRRLRAAPIDGLPGATVSYAGEEKTPFGYAYVALDLTPTAAFELNLRIEGEPGSLSFAAYRPVVTVKGDEAAFLAWVRGAPT